MVTTDAAHREGTALEPMDISVHRDLAAMPGAFDALFARLSALGLFQGREWLQNFAENGLSPGDRMRIYAVDDDGPLAVLAGVRSRLYSLHPKARVLYFSQPDGLELAPLMDGDDEARSAVLCAVIDHVRDVSGPYDVVRFGPMDPDSTPFTRVVRHLRRRGFLVQSYFNHPNWHAQVAGMSSEDYLRARSRDFRRSIRRRARRLAEHADYRFELITLPGQVQRGIDAYHRVFAARAMHLQEEPLPESYIPGAMRCAAAAGCLRLGLVHMAGQPVAYQLCLVSAGTAYFMRTGYDARFRRLGVGKNVIFSVIAHVLDVDRVGVLDFGVGDHLYKSDWVDQRRERWGIAGYNPRTLRGLRNAALHMVASRAKPVLKAARDRVRAWLP
jgi:CelD/BcsL family acetyltransferase involved in cellulose biosynthesis